MTPAATTTRYRRVLVYYDATASGQRAFEAALRMAHENGAELFIVSVALGWVNLEDVEDKALAELSLNRRKKELDALRSRIADQGLAVHMDLLEGNRPQQIVDAATRHAADVIVLGEGRISTLLRAVLASTAEQVRKLGKQPVVVIH